MSDSHQLILLIGTGPSSMDEVQAGEYRQATYFLPDRPEDTSHTPFVAEAIIRLTKEDFDQVHILGTSDAMWEVLLEHFGDALDEPTVRHLLSMEDDRPEGFGLVDRTGFGDELAHLLVDVGRDDNRAIRFPGVSERRCQGGEGLARAARALEQGVAAGVQGRPDAVHGLLLVVVCLLVREEPLVVQGGHSGVSPGRDKRPRRAR